MPPAYSVSSITRSSSSLFFFKLYGDHRDLHSFPTRRSSDLALPLRPMLRMLARLALATPLYLLSLGCGGSSQRPPQDPVAVASQSLQGRWRRVSFRPAAPLDPPLQSLLDAQMSTLTLTIEGDLFTAM